MDLSLLKNWWWLTVNGIAAMAFGVIAILYPAKTLVLLWAYFGLLALFLGAFLILGGYLNRKDTRLWDFWVFEGVLNGCIGLLLLFNDDISMPMFQVLLSLWAILLGAIQIISVFRMWAEVVDKSLYLINGILAGIFGVLIISIPWSVEHITVFIGSYTIVLGVLSILISINMKKVSGRALEDKTRIYTYHH